MERTTFTEKKEIVVNQVLEALNNPNVLNDKKKPLIVALEILNQYSFENRLEKKGLLTHTIIDSLDLEYSLGEKVIAFDNAIK